MSTHTTGKFEIKNWDEKPYDESEGTPKLTRASVTMDFQGDIEGKGNAEYLMVYGDDGSASYVLQQRIIGRLAGREGTFVLQGTGSYGGETAKGEWTVVPGSASGDLRGLRGSGGFSAGHGMVADVTLDYDFE